MGPGWISPPAPGAQASATVATGAYHLHQSEATTDPVHPPASSPKTDAALVRRKPLPPTASPVILPHPRRSGLSISSASSIYSNLSFSQADLPPRSASLQSPVSLSRHSGSSVYSIRLSSPVSNSPATSSSVRGDPSLLARRTFDRFPRGSPLKTPLRIDTSASAVNADGDDSDDSDDDITHLYKSQFTNGTPVHSRLVSEPFIPVLSSPTSAHHKRAKTMALHPPTNRPPPLHIDSSARGMPNGVTDPRQPKTPGNKISSFFGWRAATTTSPGAESSSTEISDGGRSPLPSPMPPSLPSTSFSITPSTSIPFDPTARVQANYPVRNGSLSSAGVLETVPSALVAELENELREISSELAGSIRREMELEDLVERLQSEIPSDAPNRRTSDYFSDSGSSSIRYAYESGGRIEDIEKYKRTAEQERAHLKVELGQKIQEERSRRAASESHVQILESQVTLLRRERVEISDLSSRARELEGALEGTRRKLAEERQIKDNFEDLLTAMRVELEQLRTERDLLREGKSLADPAEVQRLKEEVEALKIQNSALSQLQGGRFASIAEEDNIPVKRNSAFGLSRSNSLARVPPKPNNSSRSGSLSRSNSVSAKDRPNQESLADRVEGAENQRDALHQALKRLLDRQAYETQQSEKRIKIMEQELARMQEAGSPRRMGYEREVRNLRDEVDHLRVRAEDALDQKWQCEKGLAGLKMDLDRAEQETASLRILLQEHDIAVPVDFEDGKDAYAEVIATSSSLESAYQQLQADREHAEASVAHSPQGGSNELAESVNRTDIIAQHVRQQLATNTTLRNRLADAIGKGENDQQLSVMRINEMQSRLKDLEDSLLVAQQHAEDEMARHEDEVRQLQESHNAQLMRMKNGSRSPAALSPIPPSTPFITRSPRLDKTTSGDGVPLNQVVKSETLDQRVKELEKLLREADREMGEVVGRMNRAQIDVAELQSARDEALRETRRLQADILTERNVFKNILGRK
ncbi:hypothetical protein BDW59DRAFT_139825 [Aspergillus cavernicola]|uniref:DUF7603 domain-containing protein n=1 Tax=Aspergillus cavernicola TaxID=176166 RepID=A0ABR4IWN4_9EURO